MLSCLETISLSEIEAAKENSNILLTFFFALFSSFDFEVTKKVQKLIKLILERVYVYLL